MSCGYKRSPLSRTPPVPSMTWHGALAEYIEISDCSKAEAAQSRPLATLTSFLPPGVLTGCVVAGPHTATQVALEGPLPASRTRRARGRTAGCALYPTQTEPPVVWLGGQCDAPRFHFRMIFQVENQAFGSPVMCLNCTLWRAPHGRLETPPLHPAQRSSTDTVR